MGFTLCSGYSATTIWMVEQLGLAMIPLCRRISSGLTSGTTSGISFSILQAELLSMTTQPALAAIGEKWRLCSAPAENRAISTPSKESTVVSSTSISRLPTGSLLPAERPEAISRSEAMGKSRWRRILMNSCPTSPVAPTMATL